MTTELTVELPTKKEVVLTVTLDPTNNDVADTAVELIILLADELPTETLVALINELPIDKLEELTTALTVLLPTKKEDVLTVISEPTTIVFNAARLLAVTDAELTTALTVLLPTKKEVVLTVTFEPTVIAFVAAKLLVVTDVELTTELTDELPTVKVELIVTSGSKESCTREPHGEKVRFI